MADMMMNRGKFQWSIMDRIKNVFFPDYIMYYLKSMRVCQYYSNCKTPRGYLMFSILYHKIRFKRLGIKLGFSIGPGTLGYGVVIPHHGTIVVGGSNRIGNYAVLHTSTCITNNTNLIGDGLYLSTGAKITSQVSLGNNVSIAANSVVKSSFSGNKLLVGAPAVEKRSTKPWFIRDGEGFTQRVSNVEDLKIKLDL